MTNTVSLAANPYDALLALDAGETLTVGRVAVRAVVSPTGAMGALAYEVDGVRVSRNNAARALAAEQRRLRAEDSRAYARSLDRAEFGPCPCCEAA